MKQFRTVGTALLASLAIVLSGCSLSKYQWVHPHIEDTAGLQQHQQECNKLASRHASESDTRFFGAVHLNHRPAALRSGLAYHDDFYPHHSYHDLHRRYFRVCMEARGWQRVKLPPAQG